MKALLKIFMILQIISSRFVIDDYLSGCDQNSFLTKTKNFRLFNMKFQRQCENFEKCIQSKSNIKNTDDCFDTFERDSKNVCESLQTIRLFEINYCYRLVKKTKNI